MPLRQPPTDATNNPGPTMNPATSPETSQAPVGTHPLGSPGATASKEPLHTPTITVSPEGLPHIGKPGGEIFVVAFRGGALDAVVDLGVIHALLVTRRRPPEVVVGSSASAISAAALAEVMQEPDDDRKVARLRQFLAAYVFAPRDLARVLLPDTNEVRAETQLKSIDLPIYPKKERKDREKSVRTAFGLIRLINDLLSIRLRISDLTRFINLVLLWKKTGSTPDAGKRLAQRITLVFMLWGFALSTFYRVTPIIWRLIWAFFRPAHVIKPRDATFIIRSWIQLWVKLRRRGAHLIAGTLSFVLLFTPLLWLAKFALFMFPRLLTCWGRSRLS